MFKVGDKVRHVNENFNNTDIGVIEEVYPNNHYSVRWGTWHGVCNDPASDLIPVTPTGPVQLVPRVIPGTYGKVRVTEGGYVHCKSMKTAEEIRDTIATLEQIAEAMK